MSIIRSTAFWFMVGIMWVLATPALVSVINGFGLSGIELFLFNLVPWVVLLAIIVRVLVGLRGGTGA